MNRSDLSKLLTSIINLILVAVAFATPLLFLPFTTEFYETPKLIFLAAAVAVMLVLWSLNWVVQGKVLITRTPLDIPLILLLIVVMVSTFFSASKYISFLGNFPRVHGGAASWVIYILLYFVSVSNIKTEGHVRNVLYSLLSSTLVLSLISVAAYFGAYLPLEFVKTPNFTPTGASFSTAALAILLLPLTIISIIKPNKILPNTLAIVLATAYGVTIALIGSSSLQIIGLGVLILVLLAYKFSEVENNLPALLIPVIITLLVFLLGLIPFGKKANLFSAKKDAFPKEIQLSFPVSWKISASSFRDAPFIGTGPATYLFNFTQYKPIEFNQTPNWSLRFDQAYNEYLQIFGTLGILGLLAYLLFTLNILNLSFLGFKQKGDALAIAFSISSIAFILMLLLHTSTLTVFVGMILLLALFMQVNKYTSNKVEELTIGIKTQKMTENFSTQTLVAGDILPLIIFVIVMIGIIYSTWNGAQIVRADVSHRQALNWAQKNGLETYKSLVGAENLNPFVDLYRVDLAQTNFALANAIASSKRPTEASPGGALTDDDKQKIQQLLSQSIQEGRAAVTLSPRNAANWEVVASIYRNITGVAQNALQFSLDAYGRAIQNDPLNPVLRLNAGGVYYSVKNYDMAIRFFSDAANLKPDYPNAFYNLSVALRDKGDLKGAQLAAEQVISILQSNTQSQDYKTASEYLADLKSRIATGSAEQSKLSAPAAEQTGPLQQKNLPNVLDLPQKNDIATPAAVKK